MWRSDTMPTLSLGRFSAPVHESPSRRLFSNLKDFFAKQPVKTGRAAQETAFRISEFGEGLGENLSELFKPAPRNVHSDLLVSRDHGRFWQEVGNVLFPKKLPALQLTSKPIPVKHIWTKDTLFARVEAPSVTIPSAADPIASKIKRRVTIVTTTCIMSVSVPVAPRWCIGKAGATKRLTTPSPISSNPVTRKLRLALPDAHTPTPNASPST
jgi:hypothetical protein